LEHGTLRVVSHPGIPVKYQGVESTLLRLVAPRPPRNIVKRGISGCSRHCLTRKTLGYMVSSSRVIEGHLTFDIGAFLVEL